MKQQQTRSVGTAEEERETMPPQGLRVRLPSDMVADVFDAAEAAGTDPKGLVESVVRQSIGDGDAEGHVEVGGMRHSNEQGSVVLGQPATDAAASVAAQSDAEPDAYLRSVVSETAEGVLSDDGGQPAGPFSGQWLPAFDPLGVVEVATNGALRDPVRLAVRDTLANAGVDG
jgi:hypothetical protein